MIWIYRPNHPNANENGMIEREKVYEYQSNSAPYIISDTIQPTKHMASGRVIDSKAKFRAETRATGCVELGNEQIKPRQKIELDRGERREAIRKTIYDLRNMR